MDIARTRPRPVALTPPRCPHTDCSGHQPGDHFRYRKKGSYRRACDGRKVQRFLCLECRRTFSEQSFALSWRLKRPELTAPIFELIASKTTFRQISRLLGVRRELVEHRLLLLGEHCERWQRHYLERIVERGGIRGCYLYDELETFETIRRVLPLTGGFLIEEKTGFVVHAAVGTLPPRRPLKPGEEALLARHEAVEGKRRSESRKVTRSCFEVLAWVAPKDEPVYLRTDLKGMYVTESCRLLEGRVIHQRVSGRLHRGPRNPLFPINHTLARVRDGCSRLVRRNWGASKKRERLQTHLWVWIGYRNYVAGWRSEPAWRQRTSAAAQLGIEERKLSAEEFLRWADPLIPAA